MFMISFKIKYDESVKIALKKFQRGGGGVILEDVLRFVIFFDWWNRWVKHISFSIFRMNFHEIDF